MEDEAEMETEEEMEDEEEMQTEEEMHSGEETEGMVGMVVRATVGEVAEGGEDIEEDTGEDTG